MPQSKCNTGTDLPLSSVWDINTLVYGEPDHVKQCARGLKKQRHLSQMFFFLKDRSYKTSLCQSNDSSDINTQSNILLVCISVILSGLSYSNASLLSLGLPAEAWSANILETLTLTGATQSCSHAFQRGPNGAGNRKWSHLTQPVSEL